MDIVGLTQVAKDLGISHKQSQLMFLIKNMWECFQQRDLTEITLNPLILTKDDQFTAGNVIIHVDPDALYRQ